MVRIILSTILFFHFSFSQSQNLTAERKTTWSNAGLTSDIQAPENTVSITDFGADNTGANSSNAAYTAAISSLNGHAGTIYFPTGEYFFSSTITVPDSVFLKGDATESILRFNLGGAGNLINLTGSISTTEYELTQNAIKGTSHLTVADVSQFEVGDIIRIYMFDEDLMFSTWAYGTLGQVIEIVEINGNTITLADPLNHHYPLLRNPYIKKLNPIRAAGIECLKVERTDDAETQVSNIYFNMAYNCVVRNVESYRCDFTHVEINSSAHVQIERSYFHHAIGYGGGGRGYGAVCQVASSFCLVENNIFETLRHSMLLQSGANGNVYGYNYSTDPFWEGGFLPANSAGDVVLHGNYPYMNLFEGNTIKNIVVDASHDINGPFNTFFRNRAELYGFFSDASTVTDSMNVIGNEITNSTFPYGMFSLNGAGHLSYGNNVAETVTPSGTNVITKKTFYLSENNLPEYLNANFLPMVGYPMSISEKILPAEERFTNGEPISCAPSIVTSVANNFEKEKRIVLHGNILKINDSLLPVNVSIYSIDGKLVSEYSTNFNHTELPLVNFSGMYLIRVQSRSGEVETLKAISFN